MSLSLRITRHLARLLPQRRPRYAQTCQPVGRPRVLVAGVYVGNKPNTMDNLVEVIRASRHVDVEQRWTCMMPGDPPSPAVAAVTVRTLDQFIPKWSALEAMVGERPWETFDYVVFCDDDIWVGDGFLDQFIGNQQKYDFALAQPSRTWRSYTDWPIVRRRFLSKARQTNFVECGPVVSMDKRFGPLALPFDDRSPLGWGYDLVWPVVARNHGLKIGVIDAVPVCHSLRKRGALYKYQDELERMSAYLAAHEHIRGHEVLRRHR